MTFTPPPRPLRIAAHNGAPEWGGAEIAVSRLLAGLQDRGHRVRFFCARPEIARRAETFGLETAPLHVSGDVAVHHALRVRRALDEFDADVLLVGTFRKLLHLAAGARLAGVPVISRIGLSSDLPRNAKYRLVVRHWVDRVVVTSAQVGAAWRDALPGLPEGRIVLIPKGIDAPHAARERAEVRSDYDTGRGDVLVLALARLVEQKRLDRFVDVLAAMPPGVVGWIAGDGHLRADLEARARDRRADVRFLGHVDGVGDLLAAADMLLLTSDREGMANAMLEALAAGVPVVSTPVAGAREALGAGGDEIPPGLVTADYDVESLRRAVLTLATDAELRRAMGHAAERRVRERYGTRLMLDRWESLLREVVLGRPPGRPPGPLPRRSPGGDSSRAA